MKNYNLEPTKNPDLFRVVDAEGNWEHYYLKSQDKYLRGVTTILDRGYAKGPFFEKWLLGLTAEQQEKILSAAGEKGDKVHRWIDIVLSPTESGVVTHSRETGVYNRETKTEEPLSLDEWSCVLAWASFWQRHEPTVVISEVPLYNVKLGYAGTGDALLILTKECGVRSCQCKGLTGKIGLWDWKTGSGIRESYAAQLASYAKAENITQHTPEGKPVDYVAVLRVGTKHVTTGGYEMAVYSGADQKNAFERFLAAKAIADYGYTPFDPETDIQEIPDEVKIDVRLYVPPEKPKPVPAKKSRKPRSKKSVKQQKLV